MLDILLDLLFPPFCVSCRRAGEWWCRECRSSIDAPRFRFRYDGFERIDVTGPYHDPRLRSAIYALKYKGLTAIRRALVQYLRSRISREERQYLAAQQVVLQPLPADPRRVRERGFDHATFIAECLIEAIELPFSVVTLLHRHRGSGIAQATLESSELRVANVQDVFFLAPGVSIPRSVLLVDDVITTGATIKEAARILHMAGVQRIFGFALALGV